MKIESSVRTQVATSLLPRLNSNLCLPLLDRCGGMEGFFQENETALQTLYQELRISARLFDRSKALRQVDNELEQIDKQNIRICSIENYLYPELLKQCEDVPLVFYYKGNIQAPEGTKYLAIVGTRHSSIRCQNRVDSILSELCMLGCTPIIISGLAHGIDGTAHRASLKYNFRTFAVLGHGLHMIYPASHRTLAKSILEADGAWISEFPCTASIHPGNFLKRNRIIAGLSHATLVAESAEKGGAMSTAKLAQSYNRDVMAFAGRPDDKYSAGCNLLIKENIAALVDNGIDIAQILNYPLSVNTPHQTSLNLFETGDKSPIILNILKEKGDIQIDELSQISTIPPGELSALLLELELEQKIWALPGKRFALK